ncbi:hypothetical protein, partial [Desulfurobacterium sp.]|uniref:hypothetical protein n=1 Tax=Desulfurobacterium sp. TaxID=2004706 RepID=UPI002632ADBE
NKVLIASVPFVGSYVYKSRILQIEPKLKKGVLVTLIMNTYNPFIDYEAVKEFIYTNSRIFQTYGGYFNIIFDSVHEKIVCGISSGLIITSYNYFSKKNRLKETGVYFKYSRRTENFINSYIDRYFSDYMLNTSIKNSIQLNQVFVENLYFENEKRLAVIRVSGISHRVAVAPVSFREEIIGKNCISFFTPTPYGESLWYFAPVG